MPRGEVRTEPPLLPLNLELCATEHLQRVPLVSVREAVQQRSEHEVQVGVVTNDQLQAERAEVTTLTTAAQEHGALLAQQQRQSARELQGAVSALMAETERGREVAGATRDQSEEPQRAYWDGQLLGRPPDLAQKAGCTSEGSGAAGCEFKNSDGSYAAAPWGRAVIGNRMGAELAAVLLHAVETTGVQAQGVEGFWARGRWAWDFPMPVGLHGGTWREGRGYALQARAGFGWAADPARAGWLCAWFARGWLS